MDGNNQLKPSENNKKPKVAGVVVLALLVLGGLGCSVYTWSQNQQQQSTINDKSTQIESLDKEVASLQATVKELKKADSTQPTPTVAPDKDAAQAAAQLYLDAQVFDTKYVAAVTQLQDNFATASVSPAGRPASVLSGVYLKKVSGTWIVIFEGQNQPDKATGDRFGLPKDWYSQQ